MNVKWKHGVARMVVQAITAVCMMTVLSACLTTTGQTAGQYADDAAITTAVKSKLANDRMVNLTRIDVTTVNGTVHLMGVVESAEQKKKIGTLAAQVAGVRRVDNNLQIRRPEVEK